MGEKLTKERVLRAVAEAAAPYSSYIHDVIAREHAAHIRAGGHGHTPRTDLVLRRLRALEKDGALKRSSYPNGYYGYHWSLTPAGRKALAEAGERNG